MAVRTVDEAVLSELRTRVAGRAVDWNPAARLADITPLTGGTSSLTFVVDFDGVDPNETPVVLKVAPPGLEPTRNRDVLRQAQVQSALQGRARALAPDVLFSDAGAPPNVPPFMAMNRVAGNCVEPLLCAPQERPTPDQVVARMFDAVEVLAMVHEITPSAIGLADEPVVDLAAEVERWTRAFGTLPPEMSGDYQRAAKALLASVPAALPPVVNHGDFRLGNTLCEGDRINAVIDWEIWSVGDPRIDLAWLTFFTDEASHPATAPGTTVGTPAIAEIVSAYERAAGAPVPSLDWFHALTRYKEAGITGLLLKRAAKAGRELSDTMARMRPALPLLVDETLDILG